MKIRESIAKAIINAPIEAINLGNGCLPSAKDIEGKALACIWS